MSFDNTNTGTLNKNDKGDNPARPDYKGSGNWEGTDFWIAGWIKDGPNGKFMSIKFEEKEVKALVGNDVEPDGDIPF